MILHLAKFSRRSSGGIERVVDWCVSVSNLRGIPSTVVCFESGGVRVNSETQPLVREIPCKSSALIARQPISLGYLITAVRHARHARVVHAHAPNYIALLAVFIIRLIFWSKRIVIHWHADVYDGLLPRFLRVVEFVALHASDAVIFTSCEYYKSSFVSRFKNLPIQILPILIADPVDKVRNFSDRGSKSDSVKLIFVGRPAHYKGIEVLVRAMAELANTDIFLTCLLPIEDKALSRLVAKLGQTERVNFVIGCDDHQKWAELRESDIFILPSISRGEAYGVVLLEAMAFNLPIVTTKIDSGVRWVADYGRYGIEVEPNNPAALAAGILDTIAKIQANSIVSSRLRFEEICLNSKVDCENRLINVLYAATQFQWDS